MKIDRAQVTATLDALRDLLDDTGPAFTDAAETWLDGDTDRAGRAEARETMEALVPELEGQLQALVALIE